MFDEERGLDSNTTGQENEDEDDHLLISCLFICTPNKCSVLFTKTDVPLWNSCFGKPSPGERMHNVLPTTLFSLM